MNTEIFTSYPRIAAQVFTRPWMILPEAHEIIVRRLAEYEKTGQGPRDTAKEARFMAALEGSQSAYWLVGEDNRRADIGYNMDSESKTGQVVVAGIVGKGLSGMEMACGGVCVDQIQGALEHLAELGAKKVAMHFNTPGGVCTGVPECAAFIADYNKSIPIHAYTDTMSCSCGYYLMAGCESITAAESADIGCIGVYYYMNDLSGEWAKLGRVAHLIASGKYKGQGKPGVPIAAEYLEMMRAEVDALAEGFFAHVVEHRGEQIAAGAKKAGKDREEYAMQMMQGQSWSAGRAPAGIHDGIKRNRREHMASVLALT